MIDLRNATQEDRVNAVMQLRGWYEFGTDTYREAREGLMLVESNVLEEEIRYLTRSAPGLVGKPA